MRAPIDASRVHAFMRELGRVLRDPGTVFLTGGATAVLLGIRESSMGTDLCFDPEPPGAGTALRSLKEDLDLNLETVRPGDFLPDPPGWRERCLVITRHGAIDFFHYDPYAQVLSKVERGHTQDLADARGLVALDLVDPEILQGLFRTVRDQLLVDARFVGVDVDAFEERFDRFLASTRRVPHDNP